jgi:hypothetical protein
VKKVRRAAIGLRAHSGWAALVALAGEGGSVDVLLRERVEMTDASLPGAKQPYHAAEGLPLAEAAALLKRYRRQAGRMARLGLGEVTKELSRSGHRVMGVGILLAAGRSGSTLEATLASHALIHTADGNHFRDALREASEELGLRVTSVPERGLVDDAARSLGLTGGELQRRLVELGRPLGAPWTQDQKLAALVAWMVVVG